MRDKYITNIDWEKIARLIKKPKDFQNLHKLIDNIQAYGNLEFLHGSYNSLLPVCKELELELLNTESVSEILECYEKTSKSLVEFVPEEKIKLIQMHVDIYFIIQIHNKYKQLNAYGLNEKVSKR